MVAAAAFLVTGCGLDVADHPKQLAAAEDRMIDAVVAAGAPGVTDAYFRVRVDDFVVLMVVITIDPRTYDETTLCRSIAAIVETVPFNTTGMLAVNAKLPGENGRAINQRPNLTALGASVFLDSFGHPSTDPEGGSRIWWKEAQEIAASCS